jgi:two-component system response regulator YesN
MYNILLTDDEQIVIDSLKFILNKNFPDQITILSALSGSDAVYTARTQKIDIMFMDINMPGLNGLEAINEIKQFNPEIIIIILSAFDRFQYAQKAVELGAYKYLTKPVNRSLIIETVRGAISKIDETRGKMAGNIEMRERLSFVSTIVESDFIYSCVFGNVSELQDYLDYFRISAKKWFFCCIEIPRISADTRYPIYLQIHDIFSSQADCILGSFIQNTITAFVPITENVLDKKNLMNGKEIDDSETIQKSIVDFMGSIYSKLAMKVVSDIRIGVSSEGSDLNATVVNYNEALSALDKTTVGGGIEFAFCLSEKSVAAELNEAKHMHCEILSRVKVGDVTGVRTKLVTYCNRLFLLEKGDLNRAKNALFELMVEARNIVTNLDENYKNNAFETAFGTLSATKDCVEIEEFVQQRFFECTSDVANVLARRQNPLIVKTCDYIVKHLDETISLEQMAAKIEVSPYYLSKLFKDETGENFISYITTLRLERARDLLGNQGLSIKEISHDIGYNDQNYFSKLFRKKFDMTPTEYRNSLL